jgi:hypothetical protein
MGQLFLNKELLCIYVGVNSKKGGIPVDNFPDGRYSLRKPGKKNEDWSLQVTSDEYRKPLFMDLSALLQDELTGYDEDAPLYLSWCNGIQQMTNLAKQNIGKVVAAIEKGEKVFLTISSQCLG